MILAWLMTAFIVLPLLELMVLLRLHELVGLMDTIVVVVVTGVIGASLARTQGILVINQIQQDLAAGRMPAPKMVEGVMILIAGALLITPGLITDASGFLLLVPAVRRALGKWLQRRLANHIARGGGSFTVWRM